MLRKIYLKKCKSTEKFILKENFVFFLVPYYYFCLFIIYACSILWERKHNIKFVKCSREFLEKILLVQHFCALDKIFKKIFLL